MKLLKYIYYLNIYIIFSANLLGLEVDIAMEELGTVLMNYSLDEDLPCLEKDDKEKLKKFLNTMHSFSCNKISDAISILCKSAETLNQDLKNLYKEKWNKGQEEEFFKIIEDIKKEQEIIKKDNIHIIWGHKAAENKLKEIVSKILSKLPKYLFEENGKKELKKLFIQYIFKTLSVHGHWQKIQHKFLAETKNGNYMAFESKIIPGYHFGESFKKQFYINHNIKSIEYKGIPFGLTERSQNICNLAITEYSAENTKIFSALRMGVLSATYYNEKKEKEDIQAARRLEFLHGVVLHKIQNRFKNKKDFELMLEKNNPDNPYEIRIINISLMNQSELGITSQQEHNEKKYFLEQIEIFDILENELHEIEVSFKGQSYKLIVKIKFTEFNWAVLPSDLAKEFNGDNKIIVEKIWDLANSYNEVGLKRILGNEIDIGQIGGTVCNWLKYNKEKKPTEADIIEKLSNQIVKIWNDKSYMLLEDAYKMPSRLAILGYMLGYSIVFNCASGKDRSSILDIEIKYLLTQIVLNQNVPNPSEDLTAEEKTNYGIIAIHSGNLELQEYNNGIRGIPIYYGTEYQSLHPLYYKIYHPMLSDWIIGPEPLYKIILSSEI